MVLITYKPRLTTFLHASDDIFGKKRCRYAVPARTVTKKTLVLGNFPWQDFSPDISLIFSKIPDISLTAVKFPDISRLTRQVVTMYGSLLLSFEMCSRDGHSTDISKHRISGPQGGPAILITVTQHPYLKYNACRKKLRKFTVFLCSRKRGMVELL